MVQNCYGYSARGVGIQGDCITNSYGRSQGSHGIRGNQIMNSHGYTDGDGSGILGRVVFNCLGFADSNSDDAIRASVVSHSWARGRGTEATDDGIQAQIVIGSVQEGGLNTPARYLMP